MLLITSIFMLTHHNTTTYPTTFHIENRTNEIGSLNRIEGLVINYPSFQNQNQFNTSSSSQKRYSIFVLDLLYGWPIDPRNCEHTTTEETSKRNWTISNLQSNKSEELKHKLKSVLNHTTIKALDSKDTKVWWSYLSAIVGVFVLSASLQLVIRSANNNVTKVVFFQGLGALIYTLVGNKKIGRFNH